MVPLQEPAVAMQNGVPNMSASHYNYQKPTVAVMPRPAQEVVQPVTVPLETSVHQVKKLADKIKIWQESAKNQAQHMDVSGDSQLTDREIKELLSVPAYKRKGISLSRRLPSPKQPVVRHQLSNE